ALGLIGTDYAEQVDEVVAEAIYPACNPSPYEDLLGRDFLFMLRVLADDTPLKTSTIDAIVNQAINEWLAPQHSRCRFSSYRDIVPQGLAGLGGTKAGERFRMALDSRAAALTPTTRRPWCQLAATAARLGPLTEPMLTALVQLATGDPDPDVRVEAESALGSA